MQIAEAALKLKTAELHAYSLAEAWDGSAVRGKTLDYDARTEALARCGHAAQQVLEAVDILLDVHGASSFMNANPIQRYWRDANTAARHAGLNAAVGYEVFGKALLGVEERISHVL
jgi:alkylation response protein AidB-like acyl-CoA dehydrogenase